MQVRNREKTMQARVRKGLVDLDYGRLSVGSIEVYLGAHAELARDSRMKPMLNSLRSACISLFQT